jgi:beta-lactamase class A
MRMRLGVAIAVALIAASAFGADLQKQLEEMAAKHQGKVALYAKNVKTGATIAINADTPVQTASVIKLPLMVEAFHQVKAGKIKLSDPIELTKENQVPGSGVLAFMQPGLKLQLEDAISLMMMLSDNTATNMVIDAVGLKPTNEWLASKGLKNTYFYKKVYKKAEGPMPPDQKQFGLGKTTAREMAQVIESVLNCEVGDKALCDKMLHIMRNQQYRNMVPRFLETSDTSEEESGVADKIGALDAVRADVAIVFTKQGPIVISAFTYENQDKSWTPENQPEILIGKMAKVIVDTWAPAGVATGEKNPTATDVQPVTKK